MNAPFYNSTNDIIELHVLFWTPDVCVCVCEAEGNDIFGLIRLLLISIIFHQ